MALNDTSDIINEVLVRNNRTTTDSFITDQMLEDWLRQGSNYCSTYKPWIMSEIRDQSTAWSGNEETDYSDLGINFKANSIRYMKIGGKRMRKVDFGGYQDAREDESSGTERIFTDNARVLYINPNADVSGTLAVWGQYTPTIDPTDATATTIFSNFDEEGNEAIVEKMSSYLKRREHQIDEAELHDQRADMLLDKVWQKIQAEQHEYHQPSESDGMFARFDVVEGGLRSDQFKRDQF